MREATVNFRQLCGITAYIVASAYFEFGAFHWLHVWHTPPRRRSRQTHLQRHRIIYRVKQALNLYSTLSAPPF
jgi:hypothetical protein